MFCCAFASSLCFLTLVVHVDDLQTLGHQVSVKTVIVSAVYDGADSACETKGGNLFRKTYPRKILQTLRPSFISVLIRGFNQICS